MYSNEIRDWDIGCCPNPANLCGFLWSAMEKMTAWASKWQEQCAKNSRKNYAFDHETLLKASWYIIMRPMNVHYPFYFFLLFMDTYRASSHHQIDRSLFLPRLRRHDWWSKPFWHWEFEMEAWRRALAQPLTILKAKLCKLQTEWRFPYLGYQIYTQKMVPQCQCPLRPSQRTLKRGERESFIGLACAHDYRRRHHARRAESHCAKVVMPFSYFQQHEKMQKKSLG